MNAPEKKRISRELTRNTRILFQVLIREIRAATFSDLRSSAKSAAKGLLLARIVLGIDVVKLHWRCAVINLDLDKLGRPDVSPEDTVVDLLDSLAPQAEISDDGYTS